MKCHKEELIAAERQGKTHVLSRLPRLHQEQLTELNTRLAQETANTHLFIQNVLDQKVHTVASKVFLSSYIDDGFHLEDIKRGTVVM